MYIIRSNKRPPYMSLYDNSAYVLNITAKRCVSVTMEPNEMKKMEMESRMREKELHCKSDVETEES